ncbi:MAG: type II secretion system F family protein [Armatimonadetes bacterium]|nr:type II secretion system F family protein [Armatimonadota bacterium]
MLIAAAFLTCVAVAMLAYGLTAQRDREAVAQAIMAELAARSKPDPYAERLKEPWTKRLLAPVVAKAVAAIKSVAPKGLLQSYDLQVEMAGRPAGLTGELFLALKLLSLVAGIAVAVFLVREVPHHRMLQTLAAVLPFAAGMLAPDFVINSRIQGRRRSFARAFPDIVDLLVVSVEAGVGLDGAVQEVVKRRRDDVAAQELRRVLDYIKVGVPRADAWRKLAERMPIPELNSFVAALVQAEQLGTSIAQVLRAQSDAVRLRRTLLIREQAAKMPVKLLFPMIFFIFPCVFIVVLGPGALKIMHALSNL